MQILTRLIFAPAYSDVKIEGLIFDPCNYDLSLMIFGSETPILLRIIYFLFIKKKTINYTEHVSETEKLAEHKMQPKKAEELNDWYIKNQD